MSHPRAARRTPRQPASRHVPDPLARVHTGPVHRGPKLETGPSKNDTGVPTTPSDKDPGLPSVQPAKNDTETNDWDDSSARQKESDEDRDANTKPKKIPEDNVGGHGVLAVDDPPSPADVPDDMKFDPGGEGTPGIMPPIPAPVPTGPKTGPADPGFTDENDLGDKR